MHPAGEFGGASRSLLDLIKSFPSESIDPRLLLKRGTVEHRFSENKVPTITARGLSQWNNTSFGYYRGARWLVLLRELAYLPATLSGVVRARRMWPDTDIVHLNEITLVLLLPLVRFLFPDARIVVHARSTQNADYRRLGGRVVSKLINLHADLLIPIDINVKETLPPFSNTAVVHNGFRHSESSKLKTTSNERPIFAYVGGLIPEKGIYEFLESARICKQRGIQAEFWIVGDNVRKFSGWKRAVLSFSGIKTDVRADIETFIADNALESEVKFLGFRKDVETIYSSIDAICFLTVANAVGRPVFEAGFFGKPSIVAIRDPRPDTIVDGVTGICVSSADPVLVANAIERMCARPEEREQMGANARDLAHKYFDIESNAKKVLSQYHALLNGKQHTISSVS